jgi:hypothetical protein
VPGPYDSSVDPAGLGVRAVGSDAVSGELLDVLRVTPDLGPIGEVEAAVRQRATLFAPSALSGLAPIARVERAADGRLEIWSRRAEGFRLSTVLEWAETQCLETPLEAALTIGDRLLEALASLQAADNGPGASGHGAIGVDQVVVSETGALTLTDHAFGAVLPQLQWTRERMWRRFRVAMPPAAGLARFDHRVDVTQAAVVIAALLAGRVPGPEEYPRDVHAFVGDAVRRAAAGAGRDDRDRLAAWLRAATELEPRNAFRSAAAAREALRAALGAHLDGDASARRWLREARGLPPIEAAPIQAPSAAAPCPPPQTQGTEEPVQSRATLLGRLRRWFQER